MVTDSYKKRTKATINEIDLIQRWAYKARQIINALSFSHSERSMKTNVTTYLLAAVVIGAMGLTSVRYSQSDYKTENLDKAKELQEKKDRFPIADYEERDSNHPEKDRLRKEKQKRQNNFKIVTNKPPDWQTERVFVDDGGMNFPALPVAESSCVLVARVTKAEAHLSENKKNVYSDFTIVVERVFKAESKSVVEGSEIGVVRIGGYVRYPSGRTMLYRVSSTNMPAVNERYLFFLASKNNQDLSIVTAYAFESDGVSPLDDSPQFDALRGLSEEALIEKLRTTIAASSIEQHHTHLSVFCAYLGYTLRFCTDDAT